MTEPSTRSTNHGRVRSAAGIHGRDGGRSASAGRDLDIVPGHAQTAVYNLDRFASRIPDQLARAPVQWAKRCLGATRVGATSFPASSA